LRKLEPSLKTSPVPTGEKSSARKLISSRATNLRAAALRGCSVRLATPLVCVSARI
jgi:hypothetical protein